MSACNERDGSTRDLTPSRRDHADSSFNVYSVQSSAKKGINTSSVYTGGPVPFCLDKPERTGFGGGSSYLAPLSGNADRMQSKIEHLERERVELTMQLHRKDEKDRDRKLRLEQLEFKLRSAEEERLRSHNEAAELRNEVYRLQSEKDDLSQEVLRLQKDLHNSNRCEAMDVWKKMTATSRELKRVEEEYNLVCHERQALQNEHKALIDETQTLKQTLSTRNTELSQLHEQLALERSAAEEKMNEMLQCLEEVKGQLQQVCEQRLVSETQHLERIAGLEHEIDQLQSQLAAASSPAPVESDPVAGEAETAEAAAPNAETIASYEAIIQDLRDKLAASDQKRRVLHNQVQDLKGHVRVMVRCRPFLPHDQESDPSASLVTLHQDHSSVSMQSLVSTVGARTTQHTFSFDHTFDAASTQTQVFEEVSDLVQSVLDGYRVCIFSYGQTGSGKTHTMTGSMSGPQRGIIPRSVEQMLNQSADLIDKGWTVQTQISVLEIYNEEIRDLLVGFPQTVPCAAGGKIKIFRHPQTNKIMITGLTSMELPLDAKSAMEEEEIGGDGNGIHGSDSVTYPGFALFQKLFEYAVQARSTAHTGMNNASSRSHFIVMIDVQATSPSTAGAPGITLQGGLRLCDLAGSERLDRTNTLGDAVRLKETVHINKSLSCLADVFLALSHKASHVPYRNSKLTTLLQDCLSGDGKAMMFVNISPTVLSAQETLCSLRFANQVSQVELGKAQKNMFAASIAPSSTVAIAPPPPPSKEPEIASLPSQGKAVQGGSGGDPAPQQAKPAVSFLPPPPPTTQSMIPHLTPPRAGRSKSRSRSPVPRSVEHDSSVLSEGQAEEETQPSTVLNRPLPMTSFLSNPSAAPTNAKVLTAGAVRGVLGGASRRTSAIGLRGMPAGPLPMDPSGKTPAGAMVVYGGDSAGRENEVNSKQTFVRVPFGGGLGGGAVPSSGLHSMAKRELPTATAADGIPKRQRVDTNRKFTWR